MARHNEIGKLGEGIAKKFLVKQGLSFIEKNFSCHTGEIDLIFKEKDIFRFIEVKSIATNRGVYDLSLLSVQPEENLTRDKWQKILKTIDVYKKVKSISQETTWFVDLVCVFIDNTTREAKIRWIKHITFN